MSGFMRLKPPEFDSSDDPLVVDGWLREIEKKLDLLQCDNAECVRLATHQLVGTAGAWWDSFVATHEDPDSITWDQFVEKFRTFHIPRGAMVRKAEEFRSLKLGQMSMSEYTNKCTQLSRYVPTEVATEEQKMYRFSRGLYAGMGVHLVDCTSLKQMINKAMLLETAYVGRIYVPTYIPQEDGV